MDLQGEMVITTDSGKKRRVYDERLLPSEERASAIADELSRIFARFNANAAPTVMRFTSEVLEDTPENAAQAIMEFVLRIVETKKQGLTAGIPLQLSRAVIVSWQGRFVNLGKISGEAIRYDLMYQQLLNAFTRTSLLTITAENLRALSEATLPNGKAVSERSVTDDKFEAYAAEQAAIRAERAALRKAAAALPSGQLN